MVTPVLDFILGLIVGVCVSELSAYLSSLGVYSKAPEAKPQGVAATSVSVNGGGITLESYNARLLERRFEIL
jgi:hypothetical protein